MPKKLRPSIFLLCFFALGAHAASTPAADEAYQDAKSVYAKLKGDEAKRKLRHHWLNVAHKFDKVASKWPKSDRAPEALFTAAELYSELSRFSQNSEDLGASEAAYRKLSEGWPRHKLGDDGAFGLARLLADRRNDPGGARSVIEAALEKGGGDRKAELTKLLASLPRPAPKAVAARPSVADAIRKAGKKDEPKAVSAHAQRVEPRWSAGPPLGGGGALHLPSPNPVRIAAELDEEDLEEPIKPVVQARRAPTARPEPEDAAEDPIKPVVQARRAPVAPRPELEEPTPDEAGDDATVEGPRVPLLTNLQERLRDVRVGARALPAQDAALNQRFKQAARDGHNAEFTLAEQLGLKMRRVVIDAGHGGHDTGAIGPTGVREKDVALAIALQVAKKLQAAGLEVVLTRDDDTFVRLEDRAKFANQNRGDLFISIHCNAGPNRTMRGIETYTLNTSANRYSIRLAARENATSERGVSDLQFILADLATKANTEESTRLAQRVQKSLVRDLSAQHKGIKDLGTKEALFYVLLGAKMPAILVETSFLSHPEEEKLLGDDKYQSEIAVAISDAVNGFLEEREAKLARVD